ncbi:MAG: hypothetical protein HY006_02225 [Candidatus Sungbacteria bacterium]|nr:hypothetical protein [Candidatus Sungbacteria bacterium]
MAKNFLASLPQFVRMPTHKQRLWGVAIEHATVSSHRLSRDAEQIAVTLLTRDRIPWSYEAIAAVLTIYRNAADYLSGLRVEELKLSVQRKTQSALGVRWLMKEEIATWQQLWERYPASRDGMTTQAAHLPPPALHVVRGKQEAGRQTSMRSSEFVN